MLINRRVRPFLNPNKKMYTMDMSQPVPNKFFVLYSLWTKVHI